MDQKSNAPVTKKASVIDFFTKIWDPAWLRAWVLPYRKQPGLRAFGVRQIEVFVMTVRSLRQEEITLRAAALTYHTMLSLVPLLAVAFALFKAFGGLQKVEAPLKALIMKNLAVGRAEEVGGWLDQFITNINAGAIAGVGVLVLFYSAIGLLTNIEGSFNHIWGIQRGRPFIMRFFIYWGMITLAPPLVGFSVSLTAQLQSSVFAEAVVTWLPFGIGKWLISLASALSTCVAFILSYLIVPNTRVRIRAALVGGIVAGLLWNMTKSVFIVASAGSLKYSAVYGALGVLPLLMIWMYISWVIVLFGATYTYANQSVHTEGLELSSLKMTETFREHLAGRLVVAVAEAFYAGRPAPTAEVLADEVETMTSLVQSLLATLVAHGLLAEARGKGDDSGYLPGRSLPELTLDQVVAVLRDRDGNTFKLSDSPQQVEVSRILEEAEEAARKILGQADLRSMVTRQGEGAGGVS